MLHITFEDRNNNFNDFRDYIEKMGNAVFTEQNGEKFEFSIPRDSSLPAMVSGTGRVEPDSEIIVSVQVHEEYSIRALGTEIANAINAKVRISGEKEEVIFPKSNSGQFSSSQRKLEDFAEQSGGILLSLDPVTEVYFPAPGAKIRLESVGENIIVLLEKTFQGRFTEDLTDFLKEM